jgi:hypothetical protein
MRVLTIEEAERFPVREGKYLVPDHAEMLARGEKKAILTAVDYIKPGETYYLITEDRVLGELTVEPSQKIDLEEFMELEAKHKVTEEERKIWWPDAKELFFYRVKSFKRYDPPLAYNRKPGVQTVQKAVKPFAKLEEDTAEERTVEFNLIHRSWKGPTVIRGGRRGHVWVILLPLGERGFSAFYFDRSPVEEDEVPATLESVDDEFFNFEGNIPPDHPQNPLKELPIHQEILDRGDAIVLEDTKTFKKIIFKGDKLKGTWAIERMGDMWLLSRSLGPGGER